MFMGIPPFFRAVTARHPRLSKRANAARVWLKGPGNEPGPAFHRGFMVLLYVLVALPGILSSLHVTGYRVADLWEEDDWRILQFDSHFAAGTLHLRDRFDPRVRRIFTIGHGVRGWAPLGPAVGEIRVNSLDQVWLELNIAGVSNPSLLSGLSPHSLYRISIAPGCPPADEALLTRLSQFSGLHEIDFRNSGKLRIDGLRLDSLPNLERIWLPQPSDEEERLRLKAWGRQEKFESLKLAVQKTLLFVRVVKP